MLPLFPLWLLFADDPPKPTPTPSPPGPGLEMFLFPVLGLVMVYLFVLRPGQKRQEQERASLLTNLKKNDKVLTTAGIYGTVVSVSETEDEVTVRVDDNVRLKMVKASIARNLTNEEAAKAAKTTKKEGAA